MLLVAISNPLLAFIIVFCLCVGFVAGATWFASGSAGKEEENKYWEKMKSVNTDDPESALTNGNTPEWKKAK